MTDFHTEALLERDCTAKARCVNCEGERHELVDGWCRACLGLPVTPYRCPTLTTDIYWRLFGGRYREDR